MKKILFFLFLLILASPAFAADRYWVGGTGNWDSSTTANWSTTSGGASGASVPGSGDNAILDQAGSVVTITVSTTVTDVTWSNGTLKTDGAGDNSGLTHNWSSFVSSSSNVRTLNLGNSTINLTYSAGTKTVWNMTSSANVTVNAGTSSININGTSTGGTYLTFTSGNKTYYSLTANGPSEIVVSGTFTNLTRNGGADTSGRNTSQLNLATTTTVTGTFTVLGESATKRALVWPSSNGVPSTLDITGATLNLQYVDFQDINFVRGANLDLSTITGGSGDMGGNTLAGGYTLTFTPATTQTWQTTGAGNVSDVTKWTSRIPLPQDNVVFSSAFTGSPTITIDMMNSMGNVNLSSSTGTLTINGSYLTTNFFGNFVGRSGVTISGNVYFNSRTSSTAFTRNSTSFTAGVQFSSSNGGNITFLDNATFANVQHRSGTLTIPSGITVSMNSYVSNATSSSAPSSVVVNGTLNLTSTGTIFSLTNASNLTSVTGTGSIGITNTSASSKTFAGGGNSYPRLTISGTGSGAVIISGSNTFAELPQITGGTKTITLTAGTTQTFTGSTYKDFGNSTNVITFNSSSGGSAATLSKASGFVRGDYLSLQDIAATGGATWYAGSNSTNVSGNSGWIFRTYKPVAVRLNG